MDANSALLGYLAVLLTIGAATWAALKGLEKTTAKRKEAWGLVLGVLLGLAFHAAGYLDSPAGDPLDWYVSGFMGLVGALMAAGATNLNMLGAFSRKDPPK